MLDLKSLGEKEFIPSCDSCEVGMLSLSMLTQCTKQVLIPFLYFQARVMATIGVTRGLGDHDLKVHDSNIYIKPFLSSSPEVKQPSFDYVVCGRETSILTMLTCFSKI